MTKKMYGFKFLNPYNATEHKGNDFVYPVPGPGEKWGDWTEHPEPAEPDGKDCGSGRMHVMKRCDARYAPATWWPWFVEAEGIVGESEEKYGCHRLRLRRINKKTFWKIIKLGHCRGANLRSANLQSANLQSANLWSANLRSADLWGANLQSANLWGANLQSANLWSANLQSANLWGANLWGADLRSANLWGADLRSANLQSANLRGATVNKYTQTNNKRLLEKIKELETRVGS